MHEAQWLIGEMNQMREQFFAIIGRDPNGWIMGVSEYELLNVYCRSRMSTEDRAKFSNMTHYNGLPVYIKTSRGVELAMEFDHATRFMELKIDPSVKDMTAELF